MKKSLITISLLLCSISVYSDGVKKAHLQDFEIIQRNIKAFHPSHWAEYDLVAAQTLEKDSLILESDRTPVDVVLRRTQALINHLGAKSEQDALDRLKRKNRADLTVDDQQSLFVDIAAIRRRVAFSNPLLDFDSLVFLKHDRMARGESHMVDQYLGLIQTRGGGVFRLNNPFSGAPKAVSLLDNELDQAKGSFISLDLDYDANSILFAYTELNHSTSTWEQQPWTREEAGGQKHTAHYCWEPESSFHIFRADADGKNLRQLTDGKWDDFDPCFLPSGRIAFISARAGGNQRCGRRYLPTYTLFGMMPDGSDIQQFSWHDTNEWHPSVNHEGQIVYTRWDYVDRDSDIAHHLWFCYPDGRDPRSMHGNYPNDRESRPWMELSIRAIPESQKYLAVAAPHHGESYGSLVMIDQSIRDDRAMSQIKRITPLSAFSESETTPGKSWRKAKGDKYRDWNYGSPWPLSEDFYLCVYAPRGSKKKKGEKYGIYLVDRFGNRELIYADPTISCLDPIPLKARTRPPQIPVQTTQMKADRESDADLSMGTVSVMNVYQGEFPIPDGVKIKEMRIVNIFPKSTHDVNNPRIGYAEQSLARGVLGTVPVERDGSVYFECPTGTPIYFQLLDENGVMVQNMRSDTYLHPGEKLSCIGCHEDKHEAPKVVGVPAALKRAPSKIKPEATGSYPLNFPLLVQPVIDAHPEFFAALYPEKSLSGTEFGKWGWSQAMHTLSKDAWGKHGGNGALYKLNKRSYSLPMKEGARVSKLWKKLEAADARNELSKDELRRISLWLDCNSNFYGAYKQIEKQAGGEVVLPEHGLPEWVDAPQTLVR